MLVLTHGRINFGPPNYASTNTWSPEELHKLDCLLFGIVNDIESGREHKTDFLVIRFYKSNNIILTKTNHYNYTTKTNKYLCHSSHARADTWSPKVLDLQNCKNYTIPA